ncbi:MAG: hypothetical protein AMS22_14445 [Thiotrichales bacterium SG8_50]|nr:MAG: hypothetical protein AMS22_14445 [Thiotrichales bacterium SG8_50]
MFLFLIACLFFLFPDNSYSALVNGFIENQGQFDKRVRFYASSGNTEIFLLADGIVLSSKHLVRNEGFAAGDTLFGFQHSEKFRTGSVCIKIVFENYNNIPTINGYGKLYTKLNYFRGNIPSFWKIGVPVYRIVVYDGIWPGASIRFEHLDSGIDISLTPGGYSSARFNLIDLSLKNAHLKYLENLPFEDMCVALKSIREFDFNRTHFKSVNAGISSNSFDEMHIVLAPYLTWSTYFGGSDWDELKCLSKDSDNNIIFTGSTFSSDLPATMGAYDEDYSGWDDVFIAKMSPDGKDLIWCTYLGGNVIDVSYTLEIDNMGNAIIAGSTSSDDFPTTPGAFDRVYDIGPSAFVTKINQTGDSLIWSTYIDHAIPFDICLDSNQNPVIAGVARSDLFPTTMGAFDTDHNGGMDDGFITKLNFNGSSLIWSTFIGSYDHDRITSIAINSVDELFLTGHTSSDGFPITNDAWDSNYNGSVDGFIIKLNDSAQDLIYSTFYGGSEKDLFDCIMLDGNDDIIILGTTNTFGFPTTPGAYDYWGHPGYNTFVIKFLSDFTLSWSTLYCGPGYDSGTCMSIDSNNNIIFAGITNSTDMPTMNPIYSEYNGGYDGFVAILNTQGNNLLWGSYIGGTGYEQLNSIIIDTNGYPIVGGITASENYPTTVGSYQVDYNYEDAFITKIGGIPTPAYLSRFTVNRLREWAEIQWNIAYTIDNARFWLWRKEKSSELEQIVGPLTGNSLQWQYIDENAPLGECEYWLQMKANDDLEEWYGPEMLEAVEIVKPAFLLNQNFPNPFNPKTTLTYLLATAGRIKLTIYDIHGRQIATLIDGPMPAGSGSVSWDGLDSNGKQVASGTYLAQLETDSGIQTRKLILSR